MVSANAQAALINKARTLPKSMGRRVRRTVAGAAGAIPLAMLAAGVGASTGDPSKALSMAVAGGAAGYNIGNYYGDKAAGMVMSSAATAKGGFWGTDLKLLDQYKYDERFKNDPKIRNTLIKGVGSAEALDHEMNSGNVQALLNNNITDPGKAAKTLALKNKYMSKGLDEDQALVKAIAMAKWNRDINPGIFAPNSREQTIFKDTLAKQLEHNGYQGDLDKKIKEIMDELEYFEI